MYVMIQGNCLQIVNQLLIRQVKLVMIQNILLCWIIQSLVMLNRLILNFKTHFLLSLMLYVYFAKTEVLQQSRHLRVLVVLIHYLKIKSSIKIAVY